jgi:cytochrome P450
MDLAGRPEHQPSLRAETRAAVAACGGKIDETFLGRVPKLSAFIRESVRLASLPIQGVRWSMKEVVLDGVRIPKNTVVTNCGILARTFHPTHNPKLAYLQRSLSPVASLTDFDEDVFPGASSFDPSRFIDEDTGEECLPKGFLP